MARPTTRRKVHEAVLALARESRVGSLTMEGVAARAAVSKQTLYRSWPTTGAILFDALLARSEGAQGETVVPDTGDLGADLDSLATAMVAELTDRTVEPLLRAVTAEIQTDDVLATQYREMLLSVQMSAIGHRLRRAGVADPDEVAELFVGPILHRWLLRSRPFTADWVARHVARTVRVAG
ncbi:TetR-like C-terminal domain-containing protein [Microbacterium sp. lyk4-40-TSB-66]|uniref:TetR-like C-terminal domain-containing protein n=1 Tax=Microbacterium sp. lyk4-40-TSB-66 TaxID=3040294 RepID=UPI00254BC1C5|nr:TetR-like C-terminal domain-containing protein [Microbacterium sp. lyk4-40-TSB-66]